MKKLTIDFEVKGCDLVLNVYEKDKLDEAEVRKIFENGEDYMNALGGIAQHKDYEFIRNDMGDIKIAFDLDDSNHDMSMPFLLSLGEWFLDYAAEYEDSAEDFLKYYFEYPINYVKVYWDSDCCEGEAIYDDLECFKSETFSFKNTDRWKMLSAIKNPEQDVALIMERYKGLYRHSYSWNIDSDKFDFKKLCFHYGRALSCWDVDPDERQHHEAFLTVTYDGKLPDEWSIAPPDGDIHPSMMLLDSSSIEKLLATEETGSE